VQRASFKWFLEKGLIEELESFSPITDYTGKLELLAGRKPSVDKFDQSL